MGAHELSVTASVGVACYPDDGHEAAELLGCADEALYLAKASGKDQLAIFDPARSQRSLERTRRLHFLRRRTRVAMAWLLSDDHEPAPLRIGYTSIGRDPASDLCLAGDGVSRRHGVVKVTPDGEVTYQDCSRAGTAHNGALLEEPVRLSLGDRLTIGPYQLFVAADPTPQVQRASSQRA